jgi:hypothetical protein
MNETLSQQETLHQSPQQNLNFDNIEILHQANKQTSKYNQFFNPQNPTVNPTFLRFIQIKDYFQKALEEQKSSPPPPFQPQNLENLPPYELVSYLKNSGLGKEEIDKVLDGWIAARALDVYELRMQGLSFSEKKFSPLTKDHQAQAILDEIKEFEVDPSDPLQALTDWDFYYRLVKQVTQTEKQEDLKTISKLAQFIKNEKAKQKLQAIIQEKLSPQSPQSKETQTKKSREARKKEYKETLEKVLEYLRDVYPSESWLKEIPEKVIKILNDARESDLTPFVQAHLLAELFWMIRLNRPIPESLIADYPDYIQKAVKNFEKKYLDRSLHTEAAGFWLEKDLIMPQLTINSKDPESLKKLIIEKLVPTLISSLNQTEKAKPLSINIIIDDSYLYKLIIDPTKDIESQIRNQLSQNNPLPIKKRYYLKQDAYTFGPIKEKSHLFQQYFGHQEERKIGGITISFLKETKEDDYCIRINTKPEIRPKNHPRSLFMVEHHRAQINFDIYGDHVNLAIKFAHKHFDGLPAKNFFKKFEEELKKRFDKNEDYHGKKINQKIDTTFPLFEAQAIKKYDEILADFMFLNEKLKNFNPSFVYGLALAIANNIDYFHFLVDGPNIFKNASEYYTNVQPIVVSLLPIKDIIEKIKKRRNKILHQLPLEEKDKLTEDDKKRIEEWMKKTMEEYQRGKKGLGTPAVIAAPAGTLQEPLSKIAKIFHKGVLTLINAQGMVSVLVSLKPQKKTEGIIFHTAKSDAYQQPINISQGQGSMGVVGINQSQSIDGQTEIFITTRKTPSQAQREIKQWIDSVVSEENERKITYKIFDQILKNWEKLNAGKITLDKYEKDLEKLFQQLPEELKKRFSNKKGELQRQLNFLLQESAKKTVEADIKEAIEIIRLMLGFAVAPDDVKSI